MNNRVKEEMEKIAVPEDLSERSRRGAARAGREMRARRKRFNLAGLGIAAVLLLSLGTFLLAGESDMGELKKGIAIPALKLPTGDTSTMDMIGLIVYNGKVYTETNSRIEPAVAKNLADEKLGVTKGNIDEWSSKNAYEEELASTIGSGAAVYSVKGYDRNFRIMIYTEGDGGVRTEFYENLNGITIRSGADLFGKLQMTGNVSSANWRTSDDWFNSVENFKPVTDTAVLHAFLEELDRTEPILRKRGGDPVDQLRNEKGFKELTIELKDGTTVRLSLLEGGYIMYGAMEVYFKMENTAFSDLWKQLQ